MAHEQQTAGELQVYEVADDEWVIAESAEAARGYFIDCVGCGDDDLFPVVDVRPLTDRQLDTLTFTDHDAPSRGSVSFRQEIERRKQSGEWRPGYFATGNA